MGLFDDLVPDSGDAGVNPETGRLRITVRPQSAQPAPQPEGFRANPRGFSVDDVQAAMRGDMFNSPGLPIKYEARPGQTFGVDATKNAQPFANIVAHHTGSPTLQGALETARRGDPFRSDVKYGYHFYIDTDGTVVQGAPLEARTNHVAPPNAAQRTSRPDISNSNSVGISFVGNSSNPTPEQLAAAKNLSTSLMQRYGIGVENVVGHGEIQNNRQSGEGMPLVNAMRAQPTEVAQAPAMQMGGVANAQPRGIFDDLVPQGPQQTQAKPPQRPINQTTALAEGIRSGLTANFGDELAGAAAAGQAGADIPKSARISLIGQALSVPVGVARMIYESMTGGDNATKAYTAQRDHVRADQKASQEQYPGTYLAGQVGGGLVMPGGAGIQAASVPVRVARSAAVGAAYGGASGAGEGETPEQRVTKGATGAAIGAGVGAAAVPILGAIEGGARLANAAARPVVDRVKAALNTDAAASRKIVQSIERDAKAGQFELTTNEWNAARAAGQPVSIAELGGEGTRALARSAANLSPEGRASLQNLADRRFEGQSERAVAFIRNLSGMKTDSAAVRDSLRNEARNVNRPAYERAYREPSAQGLWDEGFQQIAQAPVVQDAIRAASITGANRGTIEGLPRIQSPFVIDKASGQLTLRTNPDGSTMLPNLQFWDHVKRNLDKINTPEARTLNSALKSHLDDLVPSYKDARAGAAKFFDAEDAMEAGANFVKRDMPVAEAQRALAQMSPREMELFKVGFFSKLVDDISNTSDRVNIVNRIGQSQAAKQKLQLVLGPNGYRSLDALMSVEQSMDKLRTALGNSTSIRQWIEVGLAGTSAGYGLATTDPTQIAVIAAIGGRRWVDQKVAKRVAEMLSSSDPNVLAQGIKAVSSSEALTKAFRNLDVRLSKLGPQAPVPGAANVPAITRADDKPEVPRPPGQ